MGNMAAYDQGPEVVMGQDAWSPQPQSTANNFSSSSPPVPEKSQYYAPAVDAGTPTQTYGNDIQTQLEPAVTETGMKGSTKTEKTSNSPVTILYIIIAILTAAVIGLAVGTGISAKDKNNTSAHVNSLEATIAALQRNATPTATNSSSGNSTSGNSSMSAALTLTEITNGCSNPNETTSGTIYTAQFLAHQNFTMMCNKNTPKSPLFSFFAPDFNTCMEGCNAWNSYNATNATQCAAISFAPSWNTIGDAKADNAPGDCYLKPGPQNLDTFSSQPGTDSALLNP